MIVFLTLVFDVAIMYAIAMAPIDPAQKFAAIAFLARYELDQWRK